MNWRMKIENYANLSGRCIWRG